MKLRKFLFSIIFIALLIGLPIFFLLYFQYFSKASYVKANIYIDTKRIIGPLPYTWKALAQGGEEMGVRMLENVVPQVSVLAPRYIRLDHIYDFYNVANRDSAGNLTFNWAELDNTICDIYRTGARPFLSLGYMPPAMSEDGSLISKPKSWNEWSLLVQKTIERYSGKSTRLCGQVVGEWFNNIYYEVWNEPDLETFGKWSLYNSSKDYKTLYSYSIQGANKAADVYHFFIGGPVTTAAYKNWFQVFLNYVKANNLRIDFLSWHHYSTNTNDYTNDMVNLNDWLSDSQYEEFRKLPKIISEWGYDSNPNPIAETNIGASHTVSAIRNLIDQKLEMAFAFDIKDGPEPRWGILTNKGDKKPRYHALNLLNLLDRYRLKVDGEGTFVQAIASMSPAKITVILVNYDQKNSNTELVPVTLTNLNSGDYNLTTTSLTDLNPITEKITVNNNHFQKSILMPPNSVTALELSHL